MRHHFRQALLHSAFAFAILCTAPVRAADFDPKVAFAAQPLPDGVNVYRSSNGAPGPGYWQNRVDYAITARLDATAKTLTATETVDYTNNSPDALPSLWMQLDQNIYRSDSRAATMGGGRKGRAAGAHSDGYAITSVEVLRGKAWVTIPFVISDTRMNLRLYQPLKGGGAKLKFRIAYRYAIPGVWGGRTSWLDTPNGTIFDIAQCSHAWPSMTICAAGTRSPISGPNSTASMAMSITQ